MATGALVQNITEDDHFAIDEDRPIRVTVTTTGASGGTPVDISGYGLEFALLKPDGTVAFTKVETDMTFDNDGTTGGVDNRANIPITDGDKAGLVAGNGYSAYLRRDDDGNEYFLWVAERVVLKKYK